MFINIENKKREAIISFSQFTIILSYLTKSSSIFKLLILSVSINLLFLESSCMLSILSVFSFSKITGFILSFISFNRLIFVYLLL